MNKFCPDKRKCYPKEVFTALPKMMRNKIHFHNFCILKRCILNSWLKDAVNRKKTEERIKCEWHELEGWAVVEEMKNGVSVDHTPVTWSHFLRLFVFLFLFGLYEKGFGVGPFLNTCELEQHVLYMRTPTSHVFGAPPIM